MAYSFLNIASAFTVFILIVLSSVLLTSNKSTTSARILAVFLLVQAALIAGEMINHSEFVLGRPGLAFWTITLPLLFGPLIYLYTNDVLFRDFNYNRRVLWHFVPFFLSLILIVIFYQLNGYNDKLAILKAYRELPRGSVPIVISSIVFSAATWIYIILSLKKIRYYHRELLNQFSTIETLRVNWLISMVALFGGLVFLIMLNSIFDIFEFPYLYELAFTGLVFAIALLFSSIFYRALTFPNFFKGLATPGDSPAVTVDGKSFAAIDKIVLEEALYTKAYFNISDLESNCGLSSGQIVALLKKEKNMSFFEYVNRLRVELAHRLLTDPALKHVHEREIMYDCGYNTKSSFYRHFREFKEKIPAEVRARATGE